jgi:hypothetical protein
MWLTAAGFNAGENDHAGTFGGSGSLEVRSRLFGGKRVEEFDPDSACCRVAMLYSEVLTLNKWKLIVLMG